MSSVAAVILAAGRATRFGAGVETSKVLALLEDKPLVVHVAEAALASRAAEVVVVSGHAAAGLSTSLAGLPVRLVHNPAFTSGMASSLQVGLAAVSPATTGAVVLLADMPRVTAPMIDQLIACFEDGGSAADAVVPERAGRPGNPVVLGRGLFTAIATLNGDQGARKLLDQPGRVVLRCAIDDPAIELDVDTPAALDALKRI